MESLSLASILVWVSWTSVRPCSSYPRLRKMQGTSLKKLRRFAFAPVCALVALGPAALPGTPAAAASPVRGLVVTSTPAVTVAPSRNVGSEFAAHMIQADPLLISGTPKRDQIRLSQRSDGMLVIANNDASLTVSPKQTDRVVIDALGGNDLVIVDGSVTVPVSIDAGDGNDVVDCSAATVGVCVDGGLGNDVIKGGSGGDSLYGGYGSDRLAGGDGVDYLDGGPGNDTLRGGPGHDMLFGGLGQDILLGGPDDDLMVGGPGADQFNGGQGQQTTYATPDDRRFAFLNAGKLHWVKGDASNLASMIDIQGDPSFRLRVISDLQALESIPMGRSLLGGINAGTHKITIIESMTSNDTTILDSADAFLNADGSAGSGSGTTISYNPGKTAIGDVSQPWMERPPVVGLFHELVHALNATTGTMQPGKVGDVPQLELQAIGLPLTHGIAWDNDGDPRTAPTSRNLPAYTENGFRQFLGLPLRTAY